MDAILYLSNANDPFSEEDLSALGKLATARNAQFDITGYLFHERDRFVQYIEGPAEHLWHLMRNIEGDTRHRVLRRVRTAELEKRRFPNWHMRVLTTGVMRQVCMEDLVTEQLSLRTLWPEDPEWRNSLWRMVDRLAAAMA